MNKKVTYKNYVVRGVDFSVEIEKEGDTEYYSITMDGFPKERFQPLLNALLELQNEDDLEYQQVVREYRRGGA